APSPASLHDALPSYFPAQDALVLREESGRRTLIPFVQQIVPEVDVPRRVVLDPPPGLLAGEDAGLVEESDEVSPAETRPDGSAPDRKSTRLNSSHVS